MPQLRGHHLICLHFFNGEGYNKAFIENLTATLTGAQAGDVTVTSGADDICTECPYLRERRCELNENADEEIREMDDKALELLVLSHGEDIDWSSLRADIPAIFPEWSSLYCGDCDWKEACERDEFYSELIEYS